MIVVDVLVGAGVPTNVVGIIVEDVLVGAGVPANVVGMIVVDVLVGAKVVGFGVTSVEADEVKISKVPVPVLLVVVPVLYAEASTLNNAQTATPTNNENLLILPPTSLFISIPRNIFDIQKNL